MTNKKTRLRILNPKELFLRTFYRILRLERKQIRIIAGLVSHLLVVWNIINLARTRAELRRMISKKRDFPYEDYPAYM